MRHRQGAALIAAATLAAALGGWPATAPASPAIAIPGTGLSLGMRLSRVDSLAAFRVAGGQPSPTQRVGRTRFFGLEATTTLDFEADRAKHAHFEVKDVSTHSRDYVEDQLRRLGLKSVCTRWDLERHECDWNGACVLHVTWQPGALTADAIPPSGWSAVDSAAAPAQREMRIDTKALTTKQTISAAELREIPVDNLSQAIATKAGIVAEGGELNFRCRGPGRTADSAAGERFDISSRPAPVAATPLAPTPAAPTLPAALTPTPPVVTTSGPMAAGGHPALTATSGPAAGSAAGLATLPDTLFIGWSHDAGAAHRARTIVPPDPPAYPASAKSAGVQGIVRLMATVDPRGYVVQTEIIHGIPELNKAAINAARACRFVPLGPPGLPQGFRVLVQVRFTLS